MGKCHSVDEKEELKNHLRIITMQSKTKNNDIFQKKEEFLEKQKFLINKNIIEGKKYDRRTTAYKHRINELYDTLVNTHTPVNGVFKNEMKKRNLSHTHKKRNEKTKSVPHRCVCGGGGI